MNTDKIIKFLTAYIKYFKSNFYLVLIISFTSQVARTLMNIHSSTEYYDLMFYFIYCTIVPLLQIILFEE